jgi:hypothetical protein
VDGIITHDELPLAPGKMANFRIATDAEFDTAGSDSGGSLTWDLDRSLANDIDTAVLLSSTTDAWYSASFPGASYVSRLSQSSDLLGVFRLEEQGLLLLGVVSPEGGLTRTELSYSPAVLLMPLPLNQGATWNTETDVSGVASGIVSVYSAGEQDDVPFFTMELVDGASLSSTIESLRGQPLGSRREAARASSFPRPRGFCRFGMGW